MSRVRIREPSPLGGGFAFWAPLYRREDPGASTSPLICHCGVSLVAGARGETEELLQQNLLNVDLPVARDVITAPDRPSPGMCETRRNTTNSNESYKQTRVP